MVSNASVDDGLSSGVVYESGSSKVVLGHLLPRRDRQKGPDHHKR